MSKKLNRLTQVDVYKYKATAENFATDMGGLYEEHYVAESFPRAVRVRGEADLFCRKVIALLRERRELNHQVNVLMHDRLGGWMDSAFNQVARTLGFEDTHALNVAVQEWRQMNGMPPLDEWRTKLEKKEG